MTECLFYGGKGGVGKTTCAAATALGLAGTHETLVVSTDPAHSLSDAFETPLGPEPRELRPGLWAAEVDPEARADRYRRLATALAADLRAAGIRLSDEEVERIFAAGAPAGGDELAALDLLVEYVDGGRYDRVVLDTAPTGHTLRLLDLPEVTGLALDTVRSLRGQVRRIGDAAKRAALGPMYYAAGRRDEGDEDDLERLQARLERARDLLSDPAVTTFRVVTVPETMAIAETERLVDRLREVGVPVGTVVVNRVLEDADEDCSRCRARARRHEERLAEIRRAFPDLAVVALPEVEGEVHGVESLAAVAERLPAE
ncbi:ArsA family ATPase [Salinilacihabitans rarus]|uniref:ArsA family ATPase n=1 Tax=Salinilacihabitans rarus TaxID=2961596 RepID=UPI0020C8DDE0|nr:ArsA family ATPase [Salinilacihabitans rarus]